jgi:DNA repair protein RadD
MLQTDLLAQRPIREVLLQKLYVSDRFHPLFVKEPSQDADSKDNLFSQPRYELDDLLKRGWMPGGLWARKFTNAFGFPEIFAGIRSSPSLLPYENIEAPVKLSDLEDFQENIKCQIMSLLTEQQGIKNRGIMRLPTGAGKTRVMIEALIELWNNRNSESKYILWVGQTEELCEQAFQSFRQLWTVKGIPGQKLRIFRFWGSGRRLPDLDEEGVIIAGISKLYHDVKGTEGELFSNELRSLGNHVAAVIVDEAHRSITAMYNNVFRTLGIKFPANGSTQIPLIGLTATPYRGYNLDETERLHKRYNKNIIYPRGNKFDNENWNDWNKLKSILTMREVLSIPKHEIISTNRRFEVSDNEVMELGELITFHRKFLFRLGNDNERNRIIYTKLMSLSRIKTSILYFAASITNANIMSALLREKDISSAVITASTPSGTRQSYIDKFKHGKIQVLSNYEVLTTGFDAPKIDAVFIGRPTNSPNLYEQMIGRGLRGPKFGGTKECLIVDLIDNIQLHGDRFIDGSEDYWNSINCLD